MGKRLVCRVAEIPENGLKECELEGGLKLVVANSGGEFFGFQAVCPHQDVPLCEGLFDGAVLTCHMHLWQWDVRSGAPIGLAEAPLQKYPLAVEGDSLYLGLELIGSNWPLPVVFQRLRLAQIILYLPFNLLGRHHLIE